MQLSNIASNSFDTNSTSGSITITNAYTASMNIKSISGTVRVTDSGAGRLDVDTTSGSINVSGSFDDVRFNSISGSQTLDNSASRAGLKADSTSGSQEFSGSFETGSLKSLSGSVTVRSVVVPSKLKIDTTSGRISIAVPNEGSISVNHSSTSGKLNSDIPMTIQSGGAQFELSSLSGSTHITAIS